MCGKKRVAFVQEKVRFNYSVAVERRTAKPLQYDNRLSVGTNILEGLSIASLLYDYTMKGHLLAHAFSKQTFQRLLSYTVLFRRENLPNR